MKKFAVAMIVAGASLVAVPSHASDNNIQFVDTPCDVTLSGVMYCGISYVPITNYPPQTIQTFEDEPVTVLVETHTFVKKGGYVMTTGPGEAAKMLAQPAVDPEVNADGTFTQAYYDRLNRQLCEIKPVFCS